LKWQFQAVKRAVSWHQSIKNGRRAISKLLRDNSSFLPKLQAVVDKQYLAALDNAVFETGLPESSFPTDWLYSVESVAKENVVGQAY
jgi:Domain of unknown function DUF29